MIGERIKHGSDFSILASIAAVISVLFAAFTYKKSADREMRYKTLEAFNVLQQRVLDQMNAYTNKEVREISFKSGSEQYKEPAALPARCEHFAVGVNMKIYPFETAGRSFARGIV